MSDQRVRWDQPDAEISRDGWVYHLYEAVYEERHPRRRPPGEHLKSIVVTTDFGAWLGSVLVPASVKVRRLAKRLC